MGTGQGVGRALVATRLSICSRPPTTPAPLRYVRSMTSRPGPHSAHAQILGEVIIAWSSVSQCLEQLFTYLADLDDAFVVGVFVEKIRDGQLDEVVSSLAAQAMDDPRDAIRDWVARVKAARKIRNEYLHGVYLPMPHGDGVEHLYVLGRRGLDRANGIAAPNLTKLLSADLISFRDELLDIERGYEQLLADHFPIPTRRAVNRTEHPSAGPR